MKLKEDFITHEAGDEHIMVATGTTAFNGLVRSNKTAAFIIECLKDKTSEEEIIQKVFDKFDAPAEVIRLDVEKLLDTLRKIGALDE